MTFKSILRKKKLISFIGMILFSVSLFILFILPAEFSESLDPLFFLTYFIIIITTIIAFIFIGNIWYNRKMRKEFFKIAEEINGSVFQEGQYQCLKYKNVILKFFSGGLSGFTGGFKIEYQGLPQLKLKVEPEFDGWEIDSINGINKEKEEDLTTEVQKWLEDMKNQDYTVTYISEDQDKISVEIEIGKFTGNKLINFIEKTEEFLNGLCKKYHNTT